MPKVYPPSGGPSADDYRAAEAVLNIRSRVYTTAERSQVTSKAWQIFYNRQVKQ